MGAKKIAKRWGNTLEGQILKVDLDRPMLELGGMVVSLGLSLAGHKDRSIMSSYICGLNPTGVASKNGNLQVGDELVEINGNVLHGKCHLNTSAIIKGVEGKRVSIVVVRYYSCYHQLTLKPLIIIIISLLTPH